MELNQGMKGNKIYHVLILDESGSMAPKASATLEGFKAYLDEIRTKDDGNQYMSIILFSDQMRDPPLMVGARLDDPSIMYVDTLYEPGGMTALYDAIGLAVTKHKEFDDGSCLFIVNIFTDGRENASREYDRETIKKMITELRSTKRWVFNYLGVEEDAVGTATGLGIKGMNTLRYDDSAIGTRRAIVTGTQIGRAHG